MITWAPNPPDAVKICKLIVSLEDCDGDIWEDPDQELSEESELDEYKVAPDIKTEVSAGPQRGNQKNTTRTFHGTPFSWPICKKNTGGSLARARLSICGMSPLLEETLL